ncbi:hypothetical protein E2320_013715, partial [Naja naja]
IFLTSSCEEEAKQPQRGTLWVPSVPPEALVKKSQTETCGSFGSWPSFALQEFQDGVTQNKTVLENGTDTPWRSKWLASTTVPLLTNGTCQALLSCAMPEEEAGDLSFTWFQVNGSMVLSTAQTLNVAQKPPQGTPDYICIVRSQAGESSSVVSLEKHCQDPPITSKYLSASFYAKYIVPPFIVLVILLVLFLMYRRKRGRAEIHSSMESINESSDSDNEVGPSLEQTAEVSFLTE